MYTLVLMASRIRASILRSAGSGSILFMRLFHWPKGVFVSPSQGTSYWKDFLITLGGPLASLVTAVAYAYLAIASPMPEVYKMVFYVLMGSSALDFWYNIKPSTEPIVLHNGTLVYNDGYTLKYIWSQLFSKDAADGEK